MSPPPACLALNSSIKRIERDLFDCPGSSHGVDMSLAYSGHFSCDVPVIGAESSFRDADVEFKCGNSLSVGPGCLINRGCVCGVGNSAIYGCVRTVPGPATAGSRWAIYIVLLLKRDARLLIYTGSGTRVFVMGLIGIPGLILRLVLVEGATKSSLRFGHSGVPRPMYSNRSGVYFLGLGVVTECRAVDVW